MAIHIEAPEDNLRVAYVSGVFNSIECKELQKQLETDIEKFDFVKLLMLLRDFSGWDESEEWGGDVFMSQNDPHIKGIAIVGDPKWRDQVYLFTAKGFRPVPIQYFEPHEEETARSWIDTI